MYCTNCGKSIDVNSLFCEFCGFKVDNSLDGTSISVATNPTTGVAHVPYIISIPKLVILSITTFGFYELYWFYKQWRAFKVESGLKGIPWLYALFSPLVSYSLFKHVSGLLRTLDESSSSFNSGFLAILYFVTFCFWRLPEHAWILGMLSVAPLIPVQKAVNLYFERKYGDEAKRSNFGFWNVTVAFIGTVVLLAACSTEQPATVGTTVNNSSSSTQISSEAYNQEEVAASVVNIFCPSTVANENISGGSGTIISDTGLILTNSHVIPQDEKNLHVDSEGCMVVLPDATTGQPKGVYWATPIVINDLSDKYDLAFMSIYSAYYDTEEGKSMGEYPQKFPAFNDVGRCTSGNVQLGEAIRVLGYPAISGGYSLTVTDGVVSSLPGDGTIVTSAKISHGNSGGLAVDKNGCMVGVPSLVSSDEAESLGIIYSMDMVNNFSTEVQTYLDKLDNK